MSNIVIRSFAAISPLNVEIFDLAQIPVPENSLLKARNVNYREVIKPALLRRMSNILKMSLFAAKKALAEAEIEIPDGIIVGTGHGCLGDTERFLFQMINNDEKLLSPTSFIQSTHNTIAGQIALDLKCNAYNATFSQVGVSFESALLDAFLKLKNSENKKHLLIGGADELAIELTTFQQKVLGGKVLCESAAFMVLSNQASKAGIELIDVEIQNSLTIDSFLNQHGVSKKDLDLAVFMGPSEDLNDYDLPILDMEELVGYSPTQSAFAFYLAHECLKNRKLPSLYVQKGMKYSKNGGYALLVNNTKHATGLILMKRS